MIPKSDKDSSLANNSYMSIISLNRIKNSFRYKLGHAVSPYLSHLLVSMRRGKYGHGPRLMQADHLLSKGIHVEMVSLDVRDINNFWNNICTNNDKIRELRGAVQFWNKTVEYYFTWRALQKILDGPEAVYIDIAGTAASPYQDIIKLLAKTSNIYVQDLIFPEGVNGNLIGGSAAKLPLPDDSVDAMTLHCSFEHFEGDADTGFVKEAGRVLRLGGRVCIVPLYLGEYAFTLCDPVRGHNISFDKETVIHFTPRWGERHGRFYSAETLANRIINPAYDAGLNARVIHFTNALDLDPSCYAHFALILDKK